MTPDTTKIAGDATSSNRARIASRPKRRARGEATQLACSRLMRLIDTMGANARLPGLRTLREQIGVSQGTLNAALDKLEQKRVLLRRERSGVYVAPHVRRRNVCLVCSLDFFLRSNASPFWQLLVSQTETLAKAHDTVLTVVFASVTEKERVTGEITDVASPLPPYVREEINQGNFDGVIAVGLPAPTVEWIESHGIAAVSFASSSRFTVTVSRTALLEQGVAALAGAGCKKIALWLPLQGYWREMYPQVAERFARIRQKAGVTFGTIFPTKEEPGGITGPEIFQPPRIENGWDYAQRVFGAESDPETRPDGILFSDDMLGLGGLMAMDNLGVVVGRDVQVASYANSGSPILLGWQNRIYRVEYDVARLVEMIFETLEDLMDNAKGDPNYVPPFAFDSPEYHSPVANQHDRLVYPRLIPPVSSSA